MYSFHGRQYTEPHLALDVTKHVYTSLSILCYSWSTFHFLFFFWIDKFPRSGLVVVTRGNLLVTFLSTAKVQRCCVLLPLSKKKKSFSLSEKSVFLTLTIYIYINIYNT
jgi:hypothetical protein